MRDIARDLGISVATVSRALNDSPRISASQKERIKAYAKEHNFCPKVIGEALRHTHSQPMKVIGVIIPEFVHYYFSSILSGIEEEARARGYRVMVAQSNERYDKEVAICDDFYKNKVCGVIVSQAKDTRQYDHFRQLMDNGVPLVFYDRICTGVNGSRVVVDDYNGAFTAVTHLIDTGCKRIAFYGSPMNLELSKNRYNGYRDAFFAINDDTAIGILYTAKRMGFGIPNDISICGFTNGERAIACDPMLTTVEQRGVVVGEEAANILISQVEGSLPRNEVAMRVVRTRLVVRGTTR